MRFFPVFLFSFAALAFGQATSPAVRFHTNLGDIDVVLAPDAAPLTVANFLNYLAKGAYTNTLFHRSVPGFIIQGGGYNLINHTPTPTPSDPPVANEFKISNTQYTISMAKLGNDPNSATSQWFFNLADNSGGSSGLDTTNSGYTVFGRVTNTASQAVINRIAGVPINPTGLASPYDAIPIYNWKSGPLVDANYVQATSIVILPNLASAGPQDAASYSLNSASGIAPGELITIFGAGLGPTQLTTLALDSNGFLTTTLAGTIVTFDGKASPVVYTSSGQISVIAPQSLDGKTTTRVIVSYNGTQGTPIQVPVVPSNPNLFTLDASGTGDAAIVRYPSGAIVNTANPASPGETLLLYGEGHGVSSPALGDGEIVGSTLPVPVAKTQLLIDGQVVPILYSGGSPTLVNGVLQINFTVPQLKPGSHAIQIQVGSQTSPTGVNLQTK